jgi:TolB-like protein/tetratricopeptide (TPR) repeat protein
MAERSGDEQATGARSRPPDVFISYASPDSAVADAVCAALERDGVTCWVAPRDVIPGEFYGDAIVRAIDAATAVVLVLSVNSVASSHVLREVERASSKRHPVISLRIDTAPLPAGLEYFLNTSQWLDASGGAPDSALPKLLNAVRRVVEGAPAPHVAAVASSAVPPSAAPPESRDSARPAGRPLRRAHLAMASLAAVALLGAAVAIAIRFLGTGHGHGGVADPVAPSATAVSLPAAPVAFAPPAHSVAVLPFLNMSGDPKQDYFSDGLSEELLNSLTSIRDLQVAARTSSFFFKGKEVDLSDIARKLNVGAVLEGSVRKDGSHVRITAQLINAVTGFHLWSHTYDRDLKEVLKLQTEIATAVTTALQATLLADAAATIELGGTQNPAAFDAYLRGKNSDRDKPGRDTLLASIAAFDQAIRLDPGFAKAYASKALSENGFAEYYGMGPEIREHFGRARSAARRALELAPELGEAHSAYAKVLGDGFLDFAGALAEHERALGLSPNDSGVLLRAAWFFADIGRSDEAAAMARRGASLDQLNPRAYRTLAIVLDDAHRYRESIEAANRSLNLNPGDTRQAALRGIAFLQLGEVEAARQSCDTPPFDWESRMCLAIAYDRLHRRPEAEAQVSAMKTELGDASAYQYAEIYAQWGDIPRALDWIEAAYRLKDPGMVSLKVDEFFGPLRKEPRFQEIERGLKFPN